MYRIICEVYIVTRLLNFSIFFEHEDYYTPVTELASRENGGISVLRGRQVVKLDPHKKRVYLDDGSEISYDKCLLATGRNQDISIFPTSLNANGSEQIIQSTLD